MSEAADNEIMLAVLAAGQSRRFGDQDKLTALLHGRMLGLHAADTLTRIAFDRRTIIASDPGHPCAIGWRAMGYDIILNEHAAEGQSASVRCAAQHAMKYGASALYVCLADMPYIVHQHIQKLSRAFDDHDHQKIIASGEGDKAMPPAIFPSSEFGTLQDLQGDHGARKLLQTAYRVAAPDGSLLDIDTPQILATENQKNPRI
ncbi:nucleotidyltransferase family protein [Parasphingorhabdus cellanae]|uniref:Nucleotidyltransferase family protein n=1 Tax=Parasphingorhabdus cellanae TaxID=2806553 RepID=A0ABX7T4R0_9SPHN|nr:nucleotidyltransferase family protein [Parasphingorhabdus cellanae]QTD55092.1 nucleotidyltransferase family protein [Parasphingorhabdus cellanae]